MNKVCKILCLLIVSFAYFPKYIQCQVTKCCPNGSVLKIAIDSTYICESNLNPNWNAHNIPSSVIPNCTAIQNVFEASEYSIELNGCVDRNSEGGFVGVSCSQNPVTNVLLINKCCPIGQSYDHSERLCKHNPESSGYFKSLFDNAVIVFDDKVPDCSENEVFVELISTNHKIGFRGKNLEVNGNVLSSEKFCIDDLTNIDRNEATKSDKHVIVRSCRERNVCNEIPCIRRCCKADQIMQPHPKGKRQCQNHPNRTNLIPIFHNIELPLDNIQKQIRLEDYGMLESWKCKKTFKLNKNDPDDLHYLNADGMLYVQDQEPYDSDNYCIENILTPNGSTEAHAFLCFDEENYEERAKFDYYPIGLSISSVFLFAVLAVYLSIPKLLNIRGKTLVCYVISLLAAYITLAILQFNKEQRSELCYEVAFFLLFCLLSSFCWQTIMCFDIWITCGSVLCTIHLLSSFVFRHNEHNRRKFLHYSAYGWGVPLAWTLFTLYAEKYKPLPVQWNPVVAVNACFLDDRLNWRNHFLFFLVPAGLHVLINCILFSVIAVHCNRLKREIHRMQCLADESCTTTTTRKKFTILKALSILNLKLFTVMGISWILEIISTFSTNETIEAILDSYNLLIGVFIFFIFVFKRKVLLELKRKFGCVPNSAGTVTPGSASTTYNDEPCMTKFSCVPDQSLINSHDVQNSQK